MALDGQKTYRIFENLIGNAAKYAMPHTRVYVKIAAEDGDAVFQMKNVSANELHLTQRRSRNVLSEGIHQEIPKDLDLDLQSSKVSWRFRKENSGSRRRRIFFKAEIRWKLVDKKDDIA